jgi:hypothetical protein
VLPILSAMKRILIALSLVLVCTSFASAQDAAGKVEDLVRKCTDEPSVGGTDLEKIKTVMDFGFCTGFFAGILDTNSFIGALLGRPLFCIPQDGISIDQAIKIFLKSAQDHPESLHHNARTQAPVVFLLAFPCKE